MAAHLPKRDLADRQQPAAARLDLAQSNSAAWSSSTCVRTLTRTVVEAALRVARDGTRKAIEAICTLAVQFKDWGDAIPTLREAVEPFDQRWV